MKCTLSIGALLLGMGVLAAPSTAFAQEANGENPLGTAKALYESAEYEGALTALDRVSAEAITGEQMRDTAVYRALCLLALNRRQDATVTIEKVVADQPLFRLSGDSMPPRLLTLVEEVRVRLGPALAQRHYQTGKKLFDAGDYPKAFEEFALVIRLLDELAGRVSDSSLADIKVLAGGFRDLAQRSIDSAKAAAAPVAGSRVNTSATESAVKTTPIESPAETGSTGIVPPVAISQELPDYPQKFASLVVAPVMEGVIEVLVGTDGEVKSATLVRPIHPVYNPILLAAAKQWRYQPATRNGKPIEFAKRITVVVRAR